MDKFIQMNKSILIGWNREYSAKKSFGVHMSTACILLVLGLQNIMRDSDNAVSERFGAVMLILAVSSIVHGLVAYTKISKFAPKVSVSGSYILIKERLMSKAIEIPWSKIKSIQMGPYQIVFSMPDEDYEFNYNSTADTSIEIKSTLREMAEVKQIEVVDK